MSVQTHAAPQGAPSLRQAYYALAVLWLVHLIANIDRFAFGIVLEKIKIDLLLSDTQVGIATGGAFVVAYLGFGVPVARWLDRANRRNILAGALALWSAMTMACGAASNFVQMALARAGLGAGESPCIPASVSLMGSLFPREKRTQVVGIFNSAAAAAGIIGTPIMGWIADHYGWRFGFVAFGVAGIVLALVVRLTLVEPARDAFGSAALPREVAPTKDNLWSVMRSLFALRAFRYVLIGHGLYGIGFFAFATWVNVVLIRSYHLNYTELGLFSGVVIGGTMAVSTVASGYFCPVVVRHTGSDRWLVYLPAIFCLLTVPLMALACTDVSLMVFKVATAAVFFCALTRTPALVGLLLDLIPASMHGTAMMVLIIFTSIIGSALGPLITGMVSDRLTLSMGSEWALRTALLWTAPPLCLVGGLVAFLPARFVPRHLAAQGQGGD